MYLTICSAALSSGTGCGSEPYAKAASDLILIGGRSVLDYKLLKYGFESTYLVMSFLDMRSWRVSRIETSSVHYTL